MQINKNAQMECKKNLIFKIILNGPRALECSLSKYTSHLQLYDNRTYMFFFVFYLVKSFIILFDLVTDMFQLYIILCKATIYLGTKSKFNTL